MGSEKMTRGVGLQFVRRLMRHVAGAISGIPFVVLLASSFACAPIRANQERQGSASNTLCYAFIRDGDLWTVCEGKRERIKVPSKVSTFAISSDGSHLAFYTRRTSPRGKVLPRQDLILISFEPSLKTVKKATDTRVEELYNSCGTILKYSVQSGSTVDLLTGQPKKLPPRGFLQCSSDTQVVGLWTPGPAMTSGGNLMVTVNGAEKLKLPSTGVGFQISPSGKYVAYVRDVSPNHKSPEYKNSFQFCLASPTGAPSCYPADEISGLSDPIRSLSDSGEILYLVELEKFCGPFACMGVGYWHPGMSKGEIIEREDSELPTWITPQAAARLRDWASTLTPQSATKQW